MNSDMADLLRAASYVATIAPSLEVAVKSLNETVRDSGNSAAPQTLSAGGTSAEKSGASLPLQGNVEGNRDTSVIAAEISRLTEATRANASVNTPAPKTSAASTSSSESNIGETMLRTAAMMTGVGPIVTGLMKLFGSNEPDPLPPLEKFVAPSSISVEAGLTASRDFGSVRYAQGGRPEATSGASYQTQAPSIQVNIQAMDSQSFLDRQDDIARAVREAMLHSNSLNDIVMEL
ncbi:MAG TPA: hypothetical protein VEX68_23135 [Bryobacteraceae bacterium]|nr:hypothetical protein [Bryobacteraceae bacterium]